MLLKTSPYLLLIFVFALLGCEPEKVCTEELKTVFVLVKTAGGEPVLLDEYVVIDVKNNEEVFRETYSPDLPYPANGTYTILSDSEIERTSKEGSEFEFIGFKDGKEIARKTFLIDNDGCHIRMISEDNTLVL